jgi:hypothetical protein
VRIAAGMFHSCALAEDGRAFAFGFCPGIPTAGQQGTPQLLEEGALTAGTTVSALSTGSCTDHAAFIAGPPPAAPGFEAPLVFAMQKKPAPKVPAHAAAVAAASAAAAAAPSVELQQPGGGGAAATASSSEHGTKRKRDSQSDNENSYDGCAHEKGSTGAAPLCL